MEFKASMTPEELSRIASEGGFFSYVAGVAFVLVTSYKIRGLEVHNYRTDLPIAKGLSSSAAVCVLLARAFNRIYDLKLTVQGEMNIAYRGEITTPSRCGRMDQCCAFGNKLILMTFDNDMVQAREIKTSVKLFLVLVDLKAAKNTTEILKCLSQAYPFPNSEQDNNLHHLLGAFNKGIMDELLQALETADSSNEEISAKVGQLMVKAQAEFDLHAGPCCPHELTAPKLHKILECEEIQQYIWGGKGVGSQGDGTAQFLAKSQEDQDALVETLERQFDVSCLKLTIGGGMNVRKAVIPAAGFASALFPASKVVKTPLFPVIDSNGIAKPAILLVVEEALEAGIEEVID